MLEGDNEKNQPPGSVVNTQTLLPPPPPRLNIARYCIAAQAAAHPDKTALIVAGSGAPQRLSYGALDLAVRRLAGGLRRLGLPHGARLMVRMDNDVPYVLTFFAALAAGLVPLPSAAALTSEEAEFLLADSEAAAIALSDDLALTHSPPASVRVLTEEEIKRLAASAEPADYADTQADDPAFLIYTSGTVGRPKGVLHGHRVAWGRRPMYQGWYGITGDDVVLHAGAFNWTYTLGVGLIDPWANGATAVLYNGPADPAVWPQLIERFGVTIFATVPSLYRRILKYASFHRDSLKTLRHGLTAGEALPPAVLEAWQAATGTPLYEALGMSEISTYISTGPGMEAKPGSPGRPQPGRRVAILDPGDADDDEADEAPAAVMQPVRELPACAIGLLAVHRSDPGLMLGYWRRPEEEALVYRGEWFCGGDLASIDADGYVWFHGRHDDILNPMGYRLSPLEIEGVLAHHPMVHEVAVGELAAGEGVHILAAFVVPHGAGDERQLLDWSKDHLATYKQPRMVVFVDHLPRTRNGKLLRRELPRQIEDVQPPSLRDD
ncbi:AMP-dependent synthetase and ligase [uncultured Defluviicoccus sp.]|uniref:AMP-dependent synthetase and ligase n=1 Tax=metagenome TaxID=256318 RepID=A0A380TE82_9ZZZZ|nr:AMP-dependent synthetase and ligase [uncultured Defluviicoccus sp.]